MAELLTQDLSVKADTILLVREANLRLVPGELVALLGPNGAGKTSLLKAALGLEKRSAGLATLDGTDSEKLSPMQRARRVAYLPQQRPLAWPNTVRDVVALGRFAYGAAPGKLSPADAEAVDRAIAQCGLADLGDRNTDTLSGGELARVHCARAFAANAPLLVADEPVAALDPRHQFSTMDIVRQFVDDGGGALVVLHDIALAARYATRMVWMKESRIVADGPPEETLTPERLAEIYGVRSRIDGRTVEIEGTL
ncbi:ABC transporter ATP-binding protein [Hyphomonas sp. GM-8P]|jgi:iron complex transport system ATP-binding protein|uniref:ABC transporter ATP-binding protein n=1 Tax=Hyphomonas sp. GM-8P TaxID=1280945 RepID=UPI000DC046D1|nr:ABC transporter ATP-binding protein [Hyphomonas sp. GM-8P]RAN39557.1 iron ABC transporter ATP-binding protein [Hyphomonas sp. GM-8P]